MSSSETLRVGVLASGRGSNFGAIAAACKSGACRAQVQVLISDQPGAGALRIAEQFGIPSLVILPRDFAGREAFETAIVTELRLREVELVCLAGYMRIVRQTLLEAFPGRILNIHPALLPAFPGLHAQRQALEHGVKVSGCSVHFVSAGVDEGPIILQAAVPVEAGDDEAALAARILEQEHKIYPAAIDLIAQNKIEIAGRRVVIGK